MKNIIPKSVKIIGASIVLSLILTFVFGLIKLSNAKGICFLIFLIFCGILICWFSVTALITLYQQIKSYGFNQTIIPILKKFAICSLILLILENVFYHQFYILRTIFFGGFISLTSIINFSKNKPDKNSKL